MNPQQQPRPLAGGPLPSNQQSYDNTVSLQSLESLIAPLKYVDKPRVARDVLGLIRNSNSLAFKIGNFVHPNGTSETLLQLLGTTPIYYKNACYNIPVSIWIVEQYPHRPPSCFVTPTKDMKIKDGHLHVDHFGMIYLPYLNQWNAQNSNLLEMVTMMSSVFSTDPPVFKVPSVGGPVAAPNNNANVQRPPQPQPQQPSPSPYNQPPFSAQSSNPYSQPIGGPSANRPAPLPASSSAYPGSNLQSPSPASHQISPQHQASPSNQQQPPQQQQQDPRATRKNQLIHTLTTKLRQQLQDDLSLKTLLMDDLLQNQQQLETHARLINEKTNQLQTELTQLQQANVTMQTKNDELNRWLEQYEKRDMVEIDKACYVKDTWSKQLLDNVSLDAALDDAYYLLDRALADDRIDLPTYTKQIRTLSKKQFYARALVAQIQQQQQQASGQQSQPSMQNGNYLGQMAGYMQQSQMH